MCYLSNICSLCLIPNQNLKSILSLDIDGTVVQEKINVFLSELIHFQPDVLKHICMNCLMVVNYIHNFRLKCLENIETLTRNYVIKTEVPDLYTNPLESGTKNDKEYLTEQQHQNNSIACNEKENTYVQNNVYVKNEFTEYENTNFMYENSQKKVPEEVVAIIINKENTSTVQENENTVVPTPYEVFEEFNEEKYIHENVNNISNINNIPDNQYDKSENVELLVNTNIKVEDYISEAESFENNESDDEYVPSDDSASTTTEIDNNDVLKEAKKLQNSTDSATTQPKEPNEINYRTGNIYKKPNQYYKPLLSENNTENVDQSIDSLFKPHKCKYCPKSYAYKCKLIIHERLHTGDRPYKCNQCDKTFTENGALKVHKRKHTGVKPFVCDICGKAFLSNHFLQKHKQTHTGAKPHKCDLCSKSFTRLDYLVEHKKCHLGNQPYECDVCGKRFNRESTVREHKRVHTGEKPFQCDVCQKTFGQKGNLRKHQRIHTGLKPYQCDVCLKTFTEASSVKIHKRKHTGEKPYECSFCNKKFQQIGHLLRHKQLHSGDKPFACEICPYRSKNKTHLKYHVQRRHGDVVPEENVI